MEQLPVKPTTSPAKVFSEFVSGSAGGLAGICVGKFQNEFVIHTLQVTR
jgi:hypothetical protein